ncbi:putative hexokinase [Phaeomoniella chlamydospora]|uniref:Phosphotransferase n=1 Tax=Phaeomoniella chlamydospora TaxID=158046 RepID=A0A0G2G2P6_PHACM|nr:putative hexokinase [Phaeomoniella chlamydospora]
MQMEYRNKLLTNPYCMLPSYNHTLPSGNETGTFLALDVGGSTFRVALVSLTGRQHGQDGIKIVRVTSTAIDEKVRSLHGIEFFDWMATKIKHVVADEAGVQERNGVIPLGLSWSFPIEQTSIRGGKIQNMGKGFNCSKGTLGQDLGVTLEAACSRQGVKVQIDAIVNDSSATLLSKAYSDPFASMSLILGTGMNCAVHMPVSQIGAQKFGERQPSWHAQAEKVITNTELSMFGGSILPKTRFDDQLNRSHALPDFQPLEYMTTGRYLGEIVRLIIFEATETAGLFGGVIPSSLSMPYTLDTQFLAILESDTTPNLSRASSYLEKTHTFTNLPSLEDLLFLRSIAECVSTRAAAYIATSIHALWSIGRDLDDAKSPVTGAEKLTIACDGSVVNKYPGFREMCSSYIASMIAAEGRTRSSTLPEIHLEPSCDAPIFGAAVAVAVAICESGIYSS